MKLITVIYYLFMICGRSLEDAGTDIFLHFLAVSLHMYGAEDLSSIALSMSITLQSQPPEASII